MGEMTGLELHTIRLRLKLTQRDLADKIGIHPVTLANYELGNALIPKAIEMAVRYLITAENPEQTEA